MGSFGGIGGVGTFGGGGGSIAPSGVSDVGGTGNFASSRAPLGYIGLGTKEAIAAGHGTEGAEGAIAGAAAEPTSFATAEGVVSSEGELGGFGGGPFVGATFGSPGGVGAPIEPSFKVAPPPTPEFADFQRQAGLRPGVVNVSGRFSGPLETAAKYLPAGWQDLLNSPAVQRGLQALAIEPVIVAVDKLAHGEPLTDQEFGALAGALLATFTLGPESAPYGAEIGNLSGIIAQGAREVSQKLFGVDVATLINRAVPGLAHRALQVLSTQRGPGAPTLQPPGPQYSVAAPEIPFEPTGQPRLVIPEQVIPARQIPEQPPPGLMFEQTAQRVLRQRLGRQPTQQEFNDFLRELRGQPRTFREPVLQPQPGTSPCPGCPPPQPGEMPCTEEAHRLVEQITNCTAGDMLARRVLEKLQVRQPAGQPAQIVIKEPVCLCCDSIGDYDDWVASGGRRGNCTVVRGVNAKMMAGETAQ